MNDTVLFFNPLSVSLKLAKLADLWFRKQVFAGELGYHETQMLVTL